MSVTEGFGYNANNNQMSSHALTVNHGTAANGSVSYAHNSLGRLSSVGRSSSSNAVSYAYDLRGWLTNISTGSFTEELFYADGPGTTLYNGNISSIRWKDNTQSSKRGYKFSYDTANRLTSGAYGEGDALSSNAGRYSESMSYDENGNIKTLQRYGKTASSYGLMDNLSISYTGNQPTSVSESASDNNSSGAMEYKKANGSGYKFNANGSLQADKSRGIAYITYDLNNNPKQIYFMNGSVTKYVYSASGQKLRAVHYTAKPNISRTWGVKPAELTSSQILQADSTDYLLGGSLTLKNGKVDKYLFDGGYAQASVASSTTDNFTFYYHTPDHLGNIREVVNANGNVQQVTNYYPFGATYAESTAADFQPYKYNGKELDKMHGLNTYDYGARQHDPILARWDRIDPLCEKYYPFSPYAYCGNSPIKNIDPDGATIIPVIYNKIDNNGNAIGQRYWSSVRVINAMTKFGRSTYGNKLISAFLPKGYTQYGVKGTGEYANYILKIKQFNTDENWYYTGEKHGSVKYGSIVPGEENGTLMFILLIDLRNNNSNAQLLETIIHELCLHGYKIKDLIKAYEKGGIDAVKRAWNQDIGGEKEHRALEKKDSTVPGVRYYFDTMNELIGPDRNLFNRE